MPNTTNNKLQSENTMEKNQMEKKSNDQKN
jgi:hypothetical protein